jgi:hypothetical protein
MIKRRTWCEYSHIGIIDGDYVIEAKGMSTLHFFLIFFRIIKNDIKYGGVVKTPITEFKSKYTKTIVREIAGDINKARAMVDNKLFDVDGLVGAWLRIDIQNSSSYFCCELVSECVDGFDLSYAHKSQPIWFLAFSKEC